MRANWANPDKQICNHQGRYDGCLECAKPKNIAKVGLSCGRFYLEVGGIILAMEGDKCRESSIPEEYRTPMPESIIKNSSFDIEMTRFLYGSEWNQKMLEYVADKINSSFN